MVIQQRNTRQSFNRGAVADTGIIPANMRFLQDTYPLKVLENRSVVSESLSQAAGREIKALKITGIFQKADELNQNGREYPLNVIQSAVDSIQEDVKERGVLGEYDHPCLTSSDFKVLTKDGWKQFSDIKVGDEVYSRVSGQMVLSEVTAKIDDKYVGKVYSFQGRHINSTFTAPHKVILDSRGDGKYVRKQVEASAAEIFVDRKRFNKHLIPRTADWDGNGDNTFIIHGLSPDELTISENRFRNAITDDLVLNAGLFTSFLGLWLAEGCLTQANHGILIYQVKDDYKPQIRQMLAQFPPGLSWSESENSFFLSDARLHKYLSALGDKYTKHIPAAVKQLDGEYLANLVYWFQIGDGRLKHGRSNVFSVSERLIRDLHECYVKSGGCCYYTKIEPKDDYLFAGHLIKAENRKPLHQLTLSETNGIHLDDRFLQIIEHDYNGRIYCLTTTHGSFYMEQNGYSFWTGNCDAKIHLDRVSHIITKVWMEGKYVYGVAEVLEDMPCGGPLGVLLRHKARVGISSRGVGDMEEIVTEGRTKFRVRPGYQFVTWDVVGEPSVEEAVMHVMENKNRLLKPPGIQIPTRSLCANSKQHGMLIRELANYLNANRLK